MNGGYNTGSGGRSGNQGGYGGGRGNDGYNLQYNAEGGYNGNNAGVKAKLYRLFKKEEQGFDGYMKLASQQPEFREEFYKLAMQEFENAEQVMEIYQEMEAEQGAGASSSFLTSMNRDIDKMEKHMQDM